jgi:sjoegren syndrome nuclear autoantigen 1
LQRYNSELTRYIENIRTGREDLHEEISKDEEEKNLLETEIVTLTDRLTILNDALIKKYEAQEEFDRTIQETEQAFMKILESSQTLLHVLKKEDSSLLKRKINVSTRKQAGKENMFVATNPHQLQSPENNRRTSKNSTSKQYQHKITPGVTMFNGSHRHHTSQQQNNVQLVEYTSSSGEEEGDEDGEESESAVEHR